jgi:hypothetical protein
MTDVQLCNLKIHLVEGSHKFLGPMAVHDHQRISCKIKDRATSFSAYLNKLMYETFHQYNYKDAMEFTVPLIEDKHMTEMNNNG